MIHLFYIMQPIQSIQPIQQKEQKQKITREIIYEKVKAERPMFDIWDEQTLTYKYFTGNDIMRVIDLVHDLFDPDQKLKRYIKTKYLNISYCKECNNYINRAKRCPHGFSHRITWFDRQTSLDRLNELEKILDRNMCWDLKGYFMHIYHGDDEKFIATKTRCIAYDGKQLTLTKQRTKDVITNFFCNIEITDYQVKSYVPGIPDPCLLAMCGGNIDYYKLFIRIITSMYTDYIDGFTVFITCSIKMQHILIDFFNKYYERFILRNKFTTMEINHSFNRSYRPKMLLLEPKDMQYYYFYDRIPTVIFSRYAKNEYIRYCEHVSHRGSSRTHHIQINDVDIDTISHETATKIILDVAYEFLVLEPLSDSVDETNDIDE